MTKFYKLGLQKVDEFGDSDEISPVVDKSYKLIE